MDLINSNKTRINILRGIFYATILLDAISALSGYMQLQLVNSLQAGEQFSEEEIAANDTRQMVVGIIMFLLILASITVFISWFYRAYFNLHKLKITGLRYSAGWAIGAWFVPFLNLARPLQIMQEIWNESQGYISKKDVGYAPQSTFILGWWWAFWLISNLLGNISGRMSLRAETIDQIILSTRIDIVNDSFDLIAATITLVMLNKAALIEEKLYEVAHWPSEQI